MTVSIDSPEDAVNAALAAIGYTLRVNSMVDGTRAANLALTIYGQTRDELLRQSDWGFAERTVSPTLLKQAPDGGYIPGITTWDPAVYPPLDARFEYALPDDCLKVRSVKPAPVFVPNFDPQPHAFRIANDNTYTPTKKVMLCNVQAAVLVYTGRVTDPRAWEPDFAEALIGALGRRLALPLAPLQANAQAEQLAGRGEAVATAIAEMQQG